MNFKMNFLRLNSSKLSRRRDKVDGGMLIVLCLVALSSLFTESCGQIVKDSPLKLSTHDLILKLGTQVSLNLTPTEHFNATFWNVSVPTVLVFRYSTPGNLQISPLSNVSLVDPDLPYNGSVINVSTSKAGRLIVTTDIVPPLDSYKPVDIFIRISVYKLAILNVIATYVGWIYFAAWSVSFYPQIYQNFQRKSVRGLSFEFVFLNITGFTVYTIYNIGLFWVPSIQNQYYAKDPTGSIPVQVNDVVFAVHAVFASGITGIQCLIYDRGSQQISYTGRTIICGIGVFIFVMLVITVSNAVTWLFFLNACSYVKLFITLIKYVPQAYLNYTRKSTSGWCIGNVLLDFTGGFFSIVQMFLISYNHDDWYSIFGDFTKFGLGLFSIIFDILFIYQHYYLYRSHREYEPIEGTSDPVMNPHEDMVTSNHVQSGSGSVDVADVGVGSIQVTQSNSIDSIIQKAQVHSEDDS